jgi:cytochrome c biogenesis protein CcmG/thiol:disulfide interchange protein DsbE
MRVSTLVSVVLSAWIIASAGCGAASAEVAIDVAAPSLVMSDLNGGTFDLRQQQGKVVLVHYWATWCAPCRKELPLLNSFYRRHHVEGLEAVGISADHRQDFGKMRKVSATLAYPTATLEGISDNGFGPPQGFPLTYVIDRAGIVRARFVDLDERMLNDAVLPLLAR